MRLSERFSQLVPSCHDLPLPTRGLHRFHYEIQQRSHVIAYGRIQSTGVTNVIHLIAHIHGSPETPQQQPLRTLPLCN